MKAAKLLVFVVVLLCLYAGPAWAQTTAITEVGQGTATTSPPNCQNPPDDRVCTTTVRGSIAGTPIANPSLTQGIVGTFTADYDFATVTGIQFSVPATGTATLTDADGSQLFISTTGTLSGPVTPGGATLNYSGTFEVTGGTGEFAGATGSGNLTATMTGSPNGTFEAQLVGTLVTPNLTLTKSDRPDPIEVGDLLAYTLTVTNQDTINPSGPFVVEDELPASVVFIDAFANRGANCEPREDETVVRCEFDNLKAGQSARITILVSPTREGRITNEALVFIEGERESPLDTATARTRVEGERDRNPFPPFDPDGRFGPFPRFDPDTDDDGIIDAIDDEIDEDDDLDDDDLDEEDEDDIFGDDEDTDDGVTADADEDGVSAEAGETDANAADDPNTDPDELAPVDEPLGEVEDEVNTEGIPLPPTGGLDFMVLALLAAPLILGLMTGGFLLMRGARR